LAFAIVLAASSAFIFGIGTIFIRIGTQRVSAVVVTVISVGVSALLAIILALSFNASEMGGLSGNTMLWLLLQGTLAYPLGRLLNYTAISMVGAARASPIFSISPVLAFGLAMLLLGERPTQLVILGTPLMAFGLALVVRAGIVSSPSLEGVVTNRVGFLFAVGSALAFGGVAVVGRHIVSSIASPFVTAACAMSFGFVMLSAMSARRIMPGFRRSPKKYLAVCVLAGLFQGAGALLLYSSLSEAPATVVTPIYSSSPLLILLLSHVFLQRLEAVNVGLVVGTALSVAGVALVVIGATT
jgi:drug/metabolite transporter (DMT)-like permease